MITFSFSDISGFVILMFAFRLMIAIALHEGKVKTWNNEDKFFGCFYISVLFVIAIHLFSL
jgi:hypothetical protein